MFSPSSYFGSGGLDDDEENNTIFKRNAEKTPIFFKDIDEDGRDDYQMKEQTFQEKRPARNGNPFAGRANFLNNPIGGLKPVGGQQQVPLAAEIFGNQHGGTVSDSSTYIGTPEYSKKTEIHTSIKVNNSATSIGSQRLGIARKQMILQSYFKSFKVLTFLTFLLFLCPMISVLLGISCVSNDSICLPRIQIQTSGFIDAYDGGLLSWFNWITINETNMSDESELSIIGKFIDGLSSLILTSPFEAKLITSKTMEMFQNKNSVIYKFSDFGYCKEIMDEYSLDTETMCHLFFQYGMDIPSVFVKDLTYMLSEAEIEGDAEYVSNIFSKNSREVLNFMDYDNFDDNNLGFYGFMSSIMSRTNSYMTMVEYVLDLMSLLIMIIVSVSFKIKANRSLLLFKNYLFESNFKRQYQEQNYKFLWIQVSLTTVVVLLWISTILKLIGVVYILGYGFKITSLLTDLEIGLIKGIKVISSGMILDIINILIHFVIGISLTLCVIYKPWIVKNVV